MSIHWKYTLFLLLFLSTFIPVFPEEWIDPYDMNIKPHIKPEKNIKVSAIPAIEENPMNNDCLKHEKASEIATEDTSTVYLKRVVGMILNFPTVDNVGQNVRSGKYVLDTDSQNYRFLLEFTQKENINIQDLRTLDSILSNVFDKKIKDDVLDFISSSQKNISALIISVETLTLVCICVGLYIVYNLFKSKFSFWYIIGYLLTIVLIIDYGVRYRMLYEEVEEHNMKVQYSDECDTNKMSWKEYFLFIADQRKCERRYITPLEVALFQVKHIIIIPMSAMGTGMGNFGNELWRALPFPWNLLIFPLMLSFVLVLVAIMMTSLNGSPFRFNLLHLIQLEFGKRSDETNRVSGPTLDRLLDSVRGGIHRPMVQDLSSASESNRKKPRKQIKNKESSPPKGNIDSSPKDKQVEKDGQESKSSKSQRTTPAKLGGSNSVSAPASIEKNRSKVENSSSSLDVSSGSKEDSKD
ncbi:unnamed protein product [Phaedon cochleariae]|uniref:Chloride channel CLIC-like protein 1 n=1 Tax=Phaedon cochleariae TaxID=80249 RepID=A0A9P0GR54_PHACE|nr:unnamed protein product [Phaedon cochleariae]